VSPTQEEIEQKMLELAENGALVGGLSVRVSRESYVEWMKRLHASAVRAGVKSVTNLALNTSMGRIEIIADGTIQPGDWAIYNDRGEAYIGGGFGWMKMDNTQLGIKKKQRQIEDERNTFLEELRKL